MKAALPAITSVRPGRCDQPAPPPRPTWGSGSRYLLDLVVAPILVLIVGGIRLAPRGWLLRRLDGIAAGLCAVLPMRSYRRNIRAILGPVAPPSLEALVRAGVVQTLSIVVDLVKVLDQRVLDVEEICAVEGHENLETALAAGRGVVLVSLHMGNWEVAVTRIARLGHPIATLYFEQISPLLDRYLNGIRERYGVQLTHQRRGLKSAMKHLKGGGIVGIMGDQDGTRNGAFTEFFGIPISAPRGMGVFAARGGSPTVLTYNRRLTGGNYVQVFEPPIFHEEGVDSSQWEITLTRRVLARMEELIRREPTQWLLAYDRFKLRHETQLVKRGLLATMTAVQKRLDGPR